MFDLGWTTALNIRASQFTHTSGYQSDAIYAGGSAKGYKAGLVLDSVSIQGTAGKYWSLNADYEVDIRQSFELDTSRRATLVMTP